MQHTYSHSPHRVGVVSSAQTGWRSAWSGAQHIDPISAAGQPALEGSGLGVDDVDFIIDSDSDILDGRSPRNLKPGMGVKAVSKTERKGSLGDIAHFELDQPQD